MENDDEILGRIFSRREAIFLAGKAGFGLAVIGASANAEAWALANLSQPQVHLVASPVLEEGPFFVDEKLNRSNIIGATARPSVINGVPLDLRLTVYHASGTSFAPMEGAQVDVWHADGHGVYSDESNPMNGERTSNQNWLRGYQLADGNGVVRFHTIVPGWYEGRTAHIHLKIRRPSAAGRNASEFTTQLFFDDTLMDKVYKHSPYDSRGERMTRNDDDHVYNDRQSDGSVAGRQMTLALTANPATGGYSAHFVVALTKANENRRANRGFGGPGAPPPGGFGPFDGG